MLFAISVRRAAKNSNCFVLSNSEKRATGPQEQIVAIDDEILVEHVIVGEHHTAISGPAVPDPRDLLVPYPAEPMTMWPISTRVNKPENDDEAILDC